MTRRVRGGRGFTLIELVVAVTVLAFVSMLIYGAFSGMKSSRDGLTRIQDRYREGRIAMARIARDLQSAYISQHVPLSPALVVQKTAFVGKVGIPGHRVDFNAFSNVQRDRNAHVSDQIEISYFASDNPEQSGTYDLVRRTSEYPDEEPGKGGRVEVLATDIDLFQLEYLDATTGLWTETWDTTQATGQTNRMPLQVRIRMVLKQGSRTTSDRGRGTLKFETTVSIPMQQPLSFAVQ
jgi:general secretion pathway protein J